MAYRGVMGRRDTGYEPDPGCEPDAAEQPHPVEQRGPHDEPRPDGIADAEPVGIGRVAPIGDRHPDTERRRSGRG
ncbi:hypothetical protein CGZ95_12785 [Enemella evansiae]|uniref:hypothetical protein n=1 Tax=Enemella evansiae TaxID=2016499 RepID=UPI000B95D8AF|nr:hypothetical protein [Enemella evansiae]OYN98085.1 hypothetical protein CGZ95_12785 [Enemella evansiae]